MNLQITGLKVDAGSGEGTRGGKIIGHTGSGKPIYGGSGQMNKHHKRILEKVKKGQSGTAFSLGASSSHLESLVESGHFKKQQGVGLSGGAYTRIK